MKRRMTQDEGMGGGREAMVGLVRIYLCFHYLVASIHFFGVSLIGMGQEDYVIFALHCQMMELKIHVA
jgi:hypothetical protein